MKKALFSLCTLSLLLSAAPTFAQTVDLLQEGRTYTPPFYQGGVLWSGEGMVQFTAIPQGLGNPSQLYYKWSKNGTVLGSLSGVGKDSLSFSDSIFSKPVDVKVEIMAEDDTTLAYAFTQITPITPSILIYEKNALYGYLFNQEASGGYMIPEQEISFAAFPLYFSVSKPFSANLTYAWRSNGREDSAESLVTYRIPEGSSGRSAVSVRVQNTKTIRQGAEQDFLVQFGNENQ